MARCFSSGLLLFLVLVASTPRAALVAGDRGTSGHLHRPDPLSGFRRYEGGYDIRNKHYWASAVFKGAYGFGLAGIWVLGGVLVLALYPVFRRRFAISADPKPRHCSLISAMAIFAFIFLMIVSSGLALAACNTFRSRASKLERTLLGAGGATCHAIRRVLSAMERIHGLLCLYNGSVCALLASSRTDLRQKLVDVRMVMNTAGRLFDAAIRLTYGVTVGIVCLSLALVTSSVVVLLLHWRPGLIMVILTCWVLTAVCWALTGIHFFIYIYIGDTCSALEEFEQNPSNSSLGSILPCPNATRADATMAELGFFTHNFINQMNFDMTKLVGKLEESDTSTKFKSRRICDPFFNPPQYDYDASRCLNNVSVDSMLRVLRKDRQNLPQDSFKMIRANAYFVQGFTSVYSDLRRLIHCSYLKEGFDNALSQQCKPLRASIKMLFFSMISLSLCLVILMVAWILKLAEKGRTSLWAKSTALEQHVRM